MSSILTSGTYSDLREIFDNSPDDIPFFNPPPPWKMALLEKIERYYSLVDQASLLGSSDLQIGENAEIAMRELIDLFDSDAIYDRAGFILRGREEIERYYRTPGPEGRLGLIGNHILTDMVVAGPELVITRGVFHRDNGDLVRFADFWELSDEGKVLHRQTLLGLGADRIKG